MQSSSEPIASPPTEMLPTRSALIHWPYSPDTTPYRFTSPHLELADGAGIPIEERSRDEVAEPLGVCAVPDAAKVMNPAFDVTPAELVDCLITERGLIPKPDRKKVAEHFGRTLAH